MKNELYIQIRNKIKELIFESEWEGHVSVSVAVSVMKSWATR